MAPSLHEEGPTTAELDVADELGLQLVRLMRMIHRGKSMVTRQGPGGIERSAYSILFHLLHEGPQRTSKLADALHAEISTISRQSSSLVQHGLVERLADPGDGRACLLAPTREGLRVFEENRKQMNKWLATVMAEWPDEDRRTLNQLLDRLTADIQAKTPQMADQNKGL